MKQLRYIALWAFAGSLLLSFFSFSPDPKRMALLVAEHDVAAAQNSQQHLWRYNFEGGLYSTKEKVVTVQGQKEKTSYVRMDLGTNTVHGNRWVITGIGNVIDVQQKKVLLDQKDQFVRGGHDSLVFFTNDIFKGKYYSVLDLKSGTYAQVKNPAFKAKRGQDVEPDCSLKNYKIHLYPTTGPKIELVRDAGYGEDNTQIEGGKARLPLCWIDNTTFIYPNFSAAKTYVALYKVSTVTKQQEKIGEADQLQAPRSACRFYETAEGEIIFVCSGNYYLIDPKKNKTETLKFLPVGYGFEIGLNETAKGRVIRYKGQDIGTYFCSDPEKASVADGCIAFTYDLVFGEERYLHGVAAWTSAGGKWKTFDNSDVAAVVGWMEY